LWQRLTQRKCDLVNEGKAILDRADAAKRDLTSSETTALDVIDVQLAEILPQLERVERQREAERTAPGAVASVDGTGRIAWGGPSKAFGTGRSYVEMFGPPSASGFGNGEDFFLAMNLGLADPRLLPVAGLPIMAHQFETNPSTGGFSVPEELVMQMMDASLETEIVRPRAQVHAMKSATKKIAGFDSSTSAGGCLFGMSPQWLPEGGTIAHDTAAMRLIELSAKKLGLLPTCSNELLQDGMSFEAQLGNAMTAALGWGMDYAFLRGTGSGQPLGVLGASCLITVAAEGGQFADSIVIQNLVNMFSRMHPACVGNSVWVASPTVIPQLLTLALPVGIGGGPIQVLNSSGTFTILTRPCIFSEKLPAIGDGGDILLADFSQYAIGIRKEISLDKSMHLGFAEDCSTFRGIVRVDGMPLWASVYTPVAGATLSPFVTLGAR
jgi:HK97 family phage major capsid protein